MSNETGRVLKRFSSAAAIVVVIAMAWRFLARDALPFASGRAAISQHYWPRWAWIATHVIAGTTALVIGGFQWMTRLRPRLVALHRWSGRLYLAGVTAAASSALFLAWFAPPDLSGGLPLAVLAAAWLACTWTALFAIRHGRVAAHRRWVARSYALTLAFVFIRVISDVPVWGPFGAWAAAAQGWLTLIVPLAILEVWFVRKRYFA